MTCDIVFCTIPYSEVSQVYSAPAILKSIVEHEGFTARTHDFGIDLFKACGKDFERFNQVQNYFIDDDDAVSKQDQQIVHDFYDTVIKWFQAHPSTYIGISVFSLYTHKCTLDLLRRIKQAGIKSKIVLGGRGAKVTESWNQYAEKTLGVTDVNRGFGQLMVDHALADYVITGDGEDAILRLLQGKHFNVDNHTDTFEYPVPDYSDYEIDQYMWPTGGPMIPITGSKGCVRNCDFCDVRFQFGKYQFRTGEDIAKEMISLSQKHGYRKFQFTDSLVNGSLKVLREFCAIMAKYNEDHPDKRITWTGQYICRPLGQTPEEVYDLLKRSGASGLIVGAESGSIHVLSHMNKKTTSLALFAELKMFQKYGIDCGLLTFVGHWSEEHEHFLEHCKMLVDIMPYVKSGTVSSVSLGVTALLLPGTPAIKEVERGDIIQHKSYRPETLWYATYNPKLTFKERMKRRLIVHGLAKRIGLPMSNELEYLLMLKSTVTQGHKQINEFYEKFQ